MTYYFRVATWQWRRHRLARRMVRHGAAPFEVLTALYADAAKHPHPAG